VRKDEGFYSSPEWRLLRALVLAEEPVCRACAEALATDVDHIVPRRRRPELALARANLQALCKACHSRKTQKGA
jgi:5-methylcytosine-specific restriction protein A